MVAHMTVGGRQFWQAYLLVFAMALVARYGAFPALGFTLDDWGHLNRAESSATGQQLLEQALRHPSRPVGTAVLMGTYRTLGEHIGRHVANGLAGFALFLLAGMRLVRQLTGSSRPAFIFGLFCALWPGIHEMFYWPNIMLSWDLAVLYPLMFSFWIGFLARRRWWQYLSVLFIYAALTFTYEIYLPAPAALAVLIPWQRGWLVRAMRLLFPFAAVVAFHLTYRFTQAFGLGNDMLGTSQYFTNAVAANFWEIRHNLMGILSWFAGPELGRIWLNGLLGLRDAGAWAVTGLFVLDLGLAWLAWRWLRQPEEDKVPASFAPLQIALCGLCLAAGPGLILTLSFPAARTLFFVAIGLFLIVGMTGRSPWRHTSWLIPALVTVMLSTQGMGRNWETGAEIQRRFQSHLAQHRTEWLNREILLVDTAALRTRVPGSLLAAPPQDFFAVTEYRGAGFLRGFGPGQIAARLAGPAPRMPRVLLDVEHGAEIRGDRLFWHERFNPQVAHSTPLADVYRVDMLTASQLPGMAATGPEPAARP